MIDYKLSMNNQSKIRVSVLTGAGASHGLGYPLAKDIHSYLFESKNLCRHTDLDFILTSESAFHTDSSKQAVSKTRAYLRAIRVLCDSYQGSETNYEDWFYIMDQVHRSISGDLDNLLVNPFIEKLAQLIPRSSFLDIQPDSQRVMSCCNDGCKMISDIVKQKLSEPPQGSSTQKLPWFNGLLKDEEIMLQSVMTLNQDRVLESFFKENSIPYADGFQHSKYDSCDEIEWDMETFYEKLPLLKLHGSVDWYQVEEKFIHPVLNREKYRKIRYLKTKRSPEDSAKQKPYPLILIGRHNKAFSYSAPLFNELHFFATKKLNDSDILIVVGYSFMDKFINRLILNWLYSKEKRRLIVVTRQISELINSSRYAIASSMMEWQELGELKYIENLSENLLWNDLKEKMLSQ